MQGPVDDADQKGGVDDLIVRVICPEEGSPSSLGICWLRVLYSCYHCCKCNKRNKPHIHDGGEEHVASRRRGRSAFG